MHQYNIKTITSLNSNLAKFEGIVLGEVQKEFRGLKLQGLRKQKSVLYDVKGGLGRG